ncbi:MAG: hypothetical protein EU539_08440 [Promethearchaeota archaeon]|nr:MAG: hypothetical protein EU539_08440 [Candidatus Lokiarchaeota archaeon]
MKPRKVVEEILKKIKKDNCINISEFLTKNNYEDLKIKELVKEIEKNHNNELILDMNNSKIYSYELVYTYFKLQLFKLIEDNIDMDLNSDKFSDFKPEDVVKIFCKIDSEFFDYLLDHLDDKNS